MIGISLFKCVLGRLMARIGVEKGCGLSGFPNSELKFSGQIGRKPDILSAILSAQYVCSFLRHLDALSYHSNLGIELLVYQAIRMKCLKQVLRNRGCT